MMRTCTSGGAAVNTCLEHLMNLHLPFGGVGESGMGAYHGKASVSPLLFTQLAHYVCTLFGITVCIV